MRGAADCGWGWADQIATDGRTQAGSLWLWALGSGRWALALALALD